MAETSGSPAFHGGGGVDQMQAAELAASHVDPELVARCRTLGAELDELYDKAVGIADRLRPLLEQMVDEEEAVMARADAVFHGLDTGITFETLWRARSLFSAWSGFEMLAARAYRLSNVLNAAIGHELVVDDEYVERALVEERGL